MTLPNPSNLDTIAGYRQALTQVSNFIEQKLKPTNVSFPEKTAYQSVFLYVQKQLEETR